MNMSYTTSALKASYLALQDAPTPAGRISESVLKLKLPELPDPFSFLWLASGDDFAHVLKSVPSHLQPERARQISTQLCG